MHRASLHIPDSSYAKVLPSKVCCFCGLQGLTLNCSFADCRRLVHSWCLTRYIPNEGCLCDLHSMYTTPRKRGLKLSAVREAVSQVALSALWKTGHYSKDSTGKADTVCSGSVFWFVICSQYFPVQPDLRHIPYFPLFPVLNLSASDFVVPEAPQTSYIEAQMEALQSELSELESEMKVLCACLPSPQPKPRRQLSEEDQLLAEIRSSSYSKEFNLLLPHKEYETANQTQLSTDLPYDDLCSVCGYSDFEDDDLLVRCSV
jgi:hypothetical protein